MLNRSLQVPIREEAPPQFLLARNRNFQIDELGLNHLFQTAETGAPWKYAEIAETMSPAVLAKTGDWMLKAVGQLMAEHGKVKVRQPYSSPLTLLAKKSQRFWKRGQKPHSRS